MPSSRCGAAVRAVRLIGGHLVAVVAEFLPLVCELFGFGRIDGPGHAAGPEARSAQSRAAVVSRISRRWRQFLFERGRSSWR